MKKVISLGIALIFAVSLVSATYCEDVKYEFEKQWQKNYTGVMDFNDDNFIDLSDLGYLGSKMDDEIWCKGIMNTIYPPQKKIVYSGGSSGMHESDFWEIINGDDFWNWMIKFFMPREEINNRLDRIEAIAYLGSEATEYEIGMMTAIVKAKRTKEQVSYYGYTCDGYGCNKVTSLS